MPAGGSVVACGILGGGQHCTYSKGVRLNQEVLSIVNGVTCEIAEIARDRRNRENQSLPLINSDNTDQKIKLGAEYINLSIQIR
jgi:hypothetical protein